jgi:hypothetical protein
MVRRFIASLVGAAALAVVGVAPLVAHTGHDHKVLGTVTRAASDHVLVKDRDNKDVTVFLTPDTKVVRAKKVMKVEDIKPGLRVVITATTVKEKDVEKRMAKQVELGGAQVTK